MGYIPLEIPPGVVKTRSGEGATGRWNDALNVRFVAGKPRKKAGFERLNPTTMLGKARGMKAWNKINGLGLYAVGTHLKLYGSTDAIDVINITPLRPVYSWAKALTTALNHGYVSVHMTGHGFSVGQLFFVFGNSSKGGSQIAGLILGNWVLVEVTDADNFKIYPNSAIGTLGASPFATTNTSTTVTVTHASHGRKTGDTVWFSGSSAVGGITIAGDYQITVLNGNSYTIVHSAPATSTTTGGGTVAYKYGLPANATVVSGGGTVPYNRYLANNPFATTNLSTTITVSHVAHGAIPGDTANISGAVAVAGITIAGDYVVQTAATDSYTITHSAAANATTTGGGAVVLANYEISPGPADKITSHRGFGQGPLGAGPFGTSTSVSSATYYDPRTWSVDNAGEDAIFCPLGGSAYYWDSSVGGRADVIDGAPVMARYAFMTEERHLQILGAGGDPMVIAWNSQDNLDDWVPSNTNTANSGRRVREGSSLVAGCTAGGGLNLIWTDTAVYRHLYTGSKYIYDTSVLAPEAGLISPQGFAKTPKGIVWMSQTRFKLYSGWVMDIPNAKDVQTWVYDNLDPNQLSKQVTLYDAVNNSVDFHFVPKGGSEPSWYVTVCLDDFSWVSGVETRSTGSAFQKGKKNPLKVLDGVVYTHETGVNADGASAPSSISLAPYQVQEDWSEFLGFDPNFKSLTGQMQLHITSYDHDETDVVDDETETLTPGDEVVDFRSSGRHISLTLSQDLLNGDWALDVPKIDVKAPRGSKR